MTRNNMQVLFAKAPEGLPDADCFEIVEGPIPEPAEGELVIRNIYLSLDPYMRGRMMAHESYVEGFEIGKPLEGDAVGQVVESNNAKFQEGDYVTGMLGWERYALSKGRGLRKLDPGEAPLSAQIGVLGMPGFTAYVGLLDIGRAKEGETVFVSAAASTVGSLAGQIAKLKGCRVAGSAGSDAKVRYCLDELGFDACFNYKTAPRLDQAVRGACPQGVDIYFENVGGAILDAVLKNIGRGARIVLCGMISQYNLSRPEGVHNLIALLVKRASIRGFIIDDHYDRVRAFAADMRDWLAEGKVKYRESVTDGLENAPKAFLGIFTGENFGKTVVRIAPESL